MYRYTKFVNWCQCCQQRVPSRIRIVLLISLGITTLPRSSIRRTIPVAFIYKNSLLYKFVLLVSVKQGDLYLILNYNISLSCCKLYISKMFLSSHSRRNARHFWAFAFSAGCRYSPKKLLILCFLISM